MRGARGIETNLLPLGARVKHRLPGPARMGILRHMLVDAAYISLLPCGLLRLRGLLPR